VFGGRSSTDTLPSQKSGQPETKGPGDQPPSLKPVRGRLAAPATHLTYQKCQGPAHPSNRLVAQLNEGWRVIDDPLQWKLQRKKGNPRPKNFGWRDRSFCTTRDGLLRWVREHCGKVEPAALVKLNALPEHHAMQNLDVPGTDQDRDDRQSKPLVSQGLVDCEIDDHPSRNSQAALL
jgi:hypothetical protein